jgi:hypothetical protein
MASPERLPVPDAELFRPALVLAQRFVQCWDLYACQLDDGSYICVHEPLNVGLLFAHLRGEITLCTYLLSQESQARFIVLDADDAQAWERLARVLAGEDVPSYLEKSRRGRHLWLFLAQAVDGREVRACDHGLLAAHQIEGVELYSKQDWPPSTRFIMMGKYSRRNLLNTSVVIVFGCKLNWHRVLSYLPSA